MRAAKLIVPLLILAAGCGGTGESEQLKPPAVGLLPCSVVEVGAVLPVSLANGCTRPGGEVYMPGNRTCTDGRIMYAEGEGESVVVGYLGETAQRGQAMFRRHYDACVF